MRLLERESQLQALGDALAQVRKGGGCIALVYGEAGSGKTSLVERFIANHKASWRVLAGACDSLFTPRPLGPFYDIAAQATGPLTDLLIQEVDRSRLFPAFLTELSEHPTIAVVEDIHWADEATLDLIKYAGRRIRQTQALLVLTYRDDDLADDHPLRFVLGDLASSHTVFRVPVPLLSKDAVQQLTEKKKVDAAELHRLTNGNAFYVTEVLAAGGGIPATVRDAVLSRAARLSDRGRRALEASAVIGLRAEAWLLEEVVGEAGTSIEECISRGLLSYHSGQYAFRHELARQIIQESINPQRKLQLHRTVLVALTAAPGTKDDLTRLAHHAHGAGDAQAVLHCAPLAARQAAKLGAHRQAAALYEVALDFATALPIEDQARMLEAYAEQESFLERSMRLVRVRQQIIEKFRAVGDTPREVRNLVLLAREYYALGYGAEAEEATQTAVALAQGLPPSPETALVYGYQSYWLSATQDYPGSVVVGRQSIVIAELSEDAEMLAWTCQNVGSTMLMMGDEQGRELLERGLTIGRENGSDYVVGLTLANWAVAAYDTCEFEELSRLLQECFAFAAAHDDDYLLVGAQSLQAMARFWQGDWAAAIELLKSIHEKPAFDYNSRTQGMYVLGRIGVRRGEADARSQLQALLELCDRTAFGDLLGHIHAGLAEEAWLRDADSQAADEARVAYDVAARQHIPWLTGELAFWRWRAGDVFIPPDWIARPYALQIAGDWQGAATEWEQRGCPYEQAMALMDGDEPARLAALKIFERLGARPIIEKFKEKMRLEGVRHIPHSPRPATRGNAFELTPREMEVLSCLVRGLHTGAIAAELGVSARTVDHHIASIFEKTGVHSRGEAVALALKHRLFSIS